MLRHAGARRGLYRDADRAASRACRAGLRRGQARADRKADGDPRRAGAGDGRGRRARRRRARRSAIRTATTCRSQRCARSSRRGALGRVRMIHTWNFTDWMDRPRRPAELDIAQGGGVTYPPGRAPVRHHPADRRRAGEERARHDVRLGRRAAARSARTRSSCNFADGAAATAVYNGYGHFSGMELIGGVGEWGFTEPPAKRAPVQRVGRAVAPEQELAAKRKRASNAIPASAPHQPHFGLTLVSCERGDIRQSPDGLLVYSEQGPRGDRAAERQEPARSGARGIRRTPSRASPSTHDRPLGPRQSRSLHRGDRVVAHRQGDRVEASGRRSA